MAIAKRFKDYPDAYFTFIDNDDVAPTNNLAERLIRGIVNERKICIGTQSKKGIWFSEVSWSIKATLKIKNIIPIDFFLKALRAHAAGQPLPSLVNIGQTVPQHFVDQARAEEKELEEEIIAEKAAAKAESSGDQTTANGKSAKADEIKDPQDFPDKASAQDVADTGQDVGQQPPHNQNEPSVKGELSNAPTKPRTRLKIVIKDTPKANYEKQIPNEDDKPKRSTSKATGTNSPEVPHPKAREQANSTKATERQDPLAP